MSNFASFAQDQLPRALGHAVGGVVGLMAPTYITALQAIPSLALVGAGIYLGSVAYVKVADNSAEIDWTIQTDTIGAIVAAIAALEFDFIGNPLIEVAGGAIIGDMLASYLMP
jgi:hypothetical protein